MRAQLLFWSVLVITTAAIHFGQFEWQIRNVWAFHLLGFFSFENMLAVAAPPSSTASAAGAGELSTVSNPCGISAGAASAAGASGVGAGAAGSSGAGISLEKGASSDKGA